MIPNDGRNYSGNILHTPNFPQIFSCVSPLELLGEQAYVEYGI